MKWFVYCLHRKEIKGVDKELVVWRCNCIEWFHSRGQQQLCQFIGKKESFNKKITVSIPEYWFGKRTRPLIYYFTTPIWRGCDVMWKLSISTVRCHNSLSLNPTKQCHATTNTYTLNWSWFLFQPRVTSKLSIALVGGISLQAPSQPM